MPSVPPYTGTPCVECHAINVEYQYAMRSVAPCMQARRDEVLERANARIDHLEGERTRAWNELEAMREALLNAGAPAVKTGVRGGDGDGAWTPGGGAGSGGKARPLVP